MTKTGTVQDFADGRLRLYPDRIATIVINAPDRRNAISRAMWADLPDLCAAIAADDGIRVVIVTGAPAIDGPVFSAGADITEFAEVYATPESGRAYNALVRSGQAALRDLPRPVIARIGGVCVGGGCGLALACDLRFAAETARLGITPAKLGLGYSWDDTANLVEKVGPARAKDMLFSGRLLSAGEARDIGLVDRVFPQDALAAETEAYATAIADLSPASIRLAKATVNRLAEPDRDGRSEVTAAFQEMFAGPDFAEGLAAFMARRPPKFR